MGDHFRQNLQDLRARLKELPKKEKKNIILPPHQGALRTNLGPEGGKYLLHQPNFLGKKPWCGGVAIGVSIFIMGVFFYTPPREVTLAKTIKPEGSVSLEKLTPEKKMGNFVYKDSQERKKLPSRADKSCAAGETTKEEIPGTRLGEKEVVMMVAGHPIEEMAPFISKRDRKVASFLVAIAKKESDWGVYSPKKFGRNCYNYWGYKGAYNLTESGYSCFDSPEQAIKVVGDKIESLLAQQVNTAERMIVWKCGRSCAGHDPAGVRKWITDVALYYGKLNS